MGVLVVPSILFGRQDGGGDLIGRFAPRQRARVTAYVIDARINANEPFAASRGCVFVTINVNTTGEYRE